jgi:hypothetical protein
MMVTSYALRWLASQTTNKSIVKDLQEDVSLAKFGKRPIMAALVDGLVRRMDALV